MCNYSVRIVKKKSKHVSLDFCGIKINSKLACGNKVVHIDETIMRVDWSRSDQYKSLKTS